MWLTLPVAVRLAAQLVALADDRETLRARYVERARSGLQSSSSTAVTS
jgi:hypothetical protein